LKGIGKDFSEISGNPESGRELTVMGFKWLPSGGFPVVASQVAPSLLFKVPSLDMVTAAFLVISQVAFQFAFPDARFR
jgi:hypothetical protein